jgi:hypothetical protein
LEVCICPCYNAVLVLIAEDTIDFGFLYQNSTPV